jgi:hypothetical protein
MTYCTSISRPLLKKINEGKSLDEIGAELCGASVKNPRRKAIRLIRELLGEETLLEHATTLKYDTGMAEIGKLEKSPHTPLQKNETAPHDEQNVEAHQLYTKYTAVDAVKELTEIFSLIEIKNAVQIIENEINARATPAIVPISVAVSEPVSTSTPRNPTVTKSTTWVWIK